MPDYTLTGRLRHLYYFRWNGRAANRLAAEAHVKALLMSKGEDDDLSSQGIHISFTSSAVEQVKAQEVETAQPQFTPRGTQERRTQTDMHPLYLLHTAWRALSAQERREFLSEMLTPNERRYLVLGWEETEEE